MIYEKRFGSSEKYLAVFFEWLEPLVTGVFEKELDDELFLFSIIEAVNNAAEHGNDYSPEKMIGFRLYLKPGCALASIADEGSGFTPVFKDPAVVKGTRGRGIALIKMNCDLVLFNRNGSQIILIKGGLAEVEKTNNNNATVSLYESIVFINEMKTDWEKSVFHVIGDVFDGIRSLKNLQVFIDMKKIKLLSSTDWGLFFAETEMDNIADIVLYNSNETLMTSARQMGIGSKGAPYDKIKVFSGVDEVFDFMVRSLSGKR